MPFSHHSHSGQFCTHANNTLEEMIEAAIRKRMTLYCLTEHMPREAQDLYPGEVTDAVCADGSVEHSKDSAVDENDADLRAATSDYLVRLFDDFYKTAHALRRKYARDPTCDQRVAAARPMGLLVGMEVDWIRPSSQAWIADLQRKYSFDLIVGSVHHVHGIPIDFDAATFNQAKAQSGDGTEEALFADYFDLQYDMLTALKPKIIGHFDLVRLKSAFANNCIKTRDEKSECRYSIWSKVQRNLQYIKTYGGIIEINSAALRKGLLEPYPQRSICQEIIRLAIPVTLSDDAHGIDQVGTYYHKAIEYVADVGFTELVHLDHESREEDGNIKMKSVELNDLCQNHPYFVHHGP